MTEKAYAFWNMTNSFKRDHRAYSSTLWRKESNHDWYHRHRLHYLHHRRCWFHPEGDHYF